MVVIIFLKNMNFENKMSLGQCNFTLGQQGSTNLMQSCKDKYGVHYLRVTFATATPPPKRNREKNTKFLALQRE